MSGDNLPAIKPLWFSHIQKIMFIIVGYISTATTWTEWFPINDISFITSLSAETTGT